MALRRCNTWESAGERLYSRRGLDEGAQFFDLRHSKRTPLNGLVCIEEVVVPRTVMVDELGRRSGVLRRWLSENAVQQIRVLFDITLLILHHRLHVGAQTLD